MQKHVINFVTTNAGKVATMRRQVASYGYEVRQVKLALTEPQADDSEAVALAKAKQAYAMLGEPVIVQDASFHIDGLNGFPGPYGKYVLKTLGVSGILRLAEPLPSRTCRFKSVLVYIDARGETRAFVHRGNPGTLAWEIDHTPSEEAWSDLWRVFIPHGASRPLTALSGDERQAWLDHWQKVSAFTQFAEWLQATRGPGVARHP